MSFNFGKSKNTDPVIFTMSTPATTSNEQPQLGLFRAAAQTSAPAFSLPTLYTFDASLFTTVTTNTHFSFGVTPSSGLTTKPLTTSVQLSPAVAAVKTSTPNGLPQSAIHTSSTAQSLKPFCFKNPYQASTGFYLKNITQAASGFSLGNITQPASTGFFFQNITRESADFPFGGIAQTSMSFSTSTASTVGFSQAISGTTTVTQAITTQMTTAITTQTPTTIFHSAQPIDAQQLVDLINYWTISLGNQEKQFINQANKITVWENMLKNQSTKLVNIYGMMEHKKKEQIDIESEIGFLLSQQKEFEDNLVILEREMQSSGVLNSLKNEKEPIYEVAQKINCQVKEISSDITEMLNDLCKANSKKDSYDLDNICHVLNCHMTALQYIEHNAENLSSMVAEVIYENARIFKSTNGSSNMPSFRK